MIWVRETIQTPDPVLPIVLGADLVWPSALLFTASGERTAIVGSFDVDVVPAGAYDRVIPYTEGIGDVLRDSCNDSPRYEPSSFGSNACPARK